MNSNHNEIIQKHRNKLQDSGKKRIEVWIDQPICLEVLKKLSSENQTRVINFLLETVSDAFDPEFFSNQEEQESRIRYMVQELKRTFPS